MDNPRDKHPFSPVNVTRWDEWQDCFLLTAEAHKASPALAGDTAVTQSLSTAPGTERAHGRGAGDHLNTKHITQ